MQEYNNTDQRLHFLCQIIAKAGRTYVPKKDDDSHTNLYFDFLGDRIIGRWIETPNGKVLLGMNLRSLDFEWIDTSMQVLHLVKSVGSTIEKIEKDLSKQIGLFGLNPDTFSDPLHFEIPTYSWESGAIIPLLQDGISKWKFYRKIANDSCNWLAGYLQQSIDPRIWPHHFDTGIYTTPTENIGIGYGLAMEDSLAGYPYFYLSGYGLKKEIQYSNLPTLIHGKWKIGEHWKGAILPLNDLKNFEIEVINHALKSFIKIATDWFLENK